MGEIRIEIFRKIGVFRIVFFKIFLGLALIIFVLFLFYPHFAKNCLFPKKYHDSVSKYSSEYNVDENYVYSIIYSESRFDENAKSEAGARGLMQITKDTFNWAKSRLEPNSTTTYEDIFDPAVNIKYGTYILSTLFKEFEDGRVVAAAYHAGRGKVSKWLSQGERSLDEFFSENKNKVPATYEYVNKVIETQQIYKKLYSEV